MRNRARFATNWQHLTQRFIRAGATCGRNACEHDNQTSYILFFIVLCVLVSGDDVTQGVSRAHGVIMKHNC